MKLSDKLNEVFFPSGIKCIICGDDIPQGSRFPVCASCAPERNLTFCLTCGRYMNVASRYCTNCKDRQWSFRKARAPFVYGGDIKHVVHRMKYGNGKYIAKEISIYLADAYFEHSLMSDIITFVPMFYKKQRLRGYNQAEELAKALGEKVSCTVDGLLVKNKQTKSNARQNAVQRAESVKDTISLKKDTDGNLPNIKGKRILLIDDVFTTGATVEECAKVLKAGGAGEINVLTFATARHSDKPHESKESVDLSKFQPKN